MKIIVCEVLGVIETYRDIFNMCKEWHLNELKKITETAHIVRFTDESRFYKNELKANYKPKLMKMQTIEDLFLKAKFDETFDYRIEKTIKDFNA